MNRKKSHGGKNKEVFVDEVARLLPVNVSFDRFEFSRLTGIIEKSAYQRINKLVEKSLLSLNGKVGLKIHYIMSEAQQSAMIIQGEINKEKHGKRGEKKTAVFTVKQIQEAELEAHKEAAEMILSSVNFI